jgi:hypothetical protein
MFACTVVEPSGSPHEFVAQLLDEEGAFKLSLVVEGS